MEENLTQAQPSVISQTSPITPPVQPPKAKKSVVLMIAIHLIAVVVFGYFVYQNIQLRKQITLPQSTPIASTTPTTQPKTDPTTNWKTHKVLGLRIELKLPNYFSQMDYPNGNETKGEKGKQFCIQYLKSDAVSFIVKRVLAGGGACSPTYFGLGTTSIDYEAGRMGGFGDLQGYTFENGKYYAKMVLGKKFEIPIELAKEITNPNGVKILRVIGKSDQPTEQNGMSSFPIAGTPGSGAIGALINFDNNTVYSGVAIEMKLDDKLTTALFDQILSTFRFTQ